MEPAERAGWFDGLWVLAWGVLSSAWCLTAAAQLSATFDEPLYLERGLECWRTGSHQGLMRLGTMPLPVDACTLPLYLWERVHGVRLDPANDLDRVLPWARAANLAFWWLLLVYGWRAGRDLAGRWGGRLAVALLACEPTLLGNAALATTDLSVAACVLALAYHYRTGRAAGWPRRVGLPLLWFAAAVLAKASALTFGSVYLLVIELCARYRGNPAAPPWRRFDLTGARRSLRDLAQIVAGGMVLVFIYCGSDWQAEPSFIAWARRLPEGAFGSSMVWLSEHLCVFSNAGEALMRQVRHNLRGHGSFLLGRWDGRYIWYFFPVALTIKLSAPLLAAPVVLAAVRPRALLNWACLSAGVLVLFSLQCHVQIGVRLVLPLVVLAIVGLAAAAVRACQSVRPGWRRNAFTGGIAAAVLGVAGAAVTVWPHGLCFTNVLWGGTWEGHRLVSDANYDWGQGLFELADWQRRQGSPPLCVWYYGSDPRVNRLSHGHLPLHTLPIARPEDTADHVRGRYLAVSTTLLNARPKGVPAYPHVIAFLEEHRPVARTTTYFIYDFTQLPPPAPGQP